MKPGTLTARRQLLNRLVRRLVGRNPEHGIELELIRDLAGGADVAGMRWIESAA